MNDGVDQAGTHGTTPSPSVFDRDELWAQLPLCPDWPDLN